MVNEHGFHIAEVAAFLFVALDELVFEKLNVRLHFVGVEDDCIVHIPFGLELPDLAVEELAVVVDVHQLVLSLQIGRADRELLFDRHHFLVYC